MIGVQQRNGIAVGNTSGVDLYAIIFWRAPKRRHVASEYLINIILIVIV